MTKLNLTQEWDKVFSKNENVNHKKVTFKNHFGIELAADMYWPKKEGKLIQDYSLMHQKLEARLW